jgi:hypothetical protein
MTKSNFKQPESQEMYTYTRNGKQFSTSNLDAALIRRTEGNIEVEELNLKSRKIVTKSLRVE